MKKDEICKCDFLKGAENFMNTPDPVFGLGNSRFWLLPETHPFNDAAIWHDNQYWVRYSGELEDATSERIDKEFYEKCLAIAGKSWWLKSQARGFYYIVRIWGRFNWPKPKQEL